MSLDSRALRRKDAERRESKRREGTDIKVREILQTQGLVRSMVPVAYRSESSVPPGSLSTSVLRIWIAQPICRKEGKRHSHAVRNVRPRGVGVANFRNAING